MSKPTNETLKLVYERCERVVDGVREQCPERATVVTADGDLYCGPHAAEEED